MVGRLDVAGTGGKKTLEPSSNKSITITIQRLRARYIAGLLLRSVCVCSSFCFALSAPLLTDPTFTFVFYMCVRERVLRTVGLNISGGMYENKLWMVSDLPFKSLKKKVCSTATQSMTCFAFSVCSYPWFKKLLTISERCGTTTSSSVHGMFFTRHASCCREMHIHM